jgi:hypothetical protein
MWEIAEGRWQKAGERKQLMPFPNQVSALDGFLLWAVLGLIYH